MIFDAWYKIKIALLIKKTKEDEITVFWYVKGYEIPLNVEIYTVKKFHEKFDCMGLEFLEKAKGKKYE